MGTVIVYLDDILIFTATMEEHRKMVHRALEKLRKNRLFLCKAKCSFEKPEVQYLGLIVGNGEVRTDPEKIEAVAKWKVPTTKKALQSFLRFVNFYRRFVKDFSKIAKPLHLLTGKVPWCWGKPQEKSFDNLKTALCTEPILRIPTDDAPFRVEMDCSQ